MTTEAIEVSAGDETDGRGEAAGCMRGESPWCLTLADGALLRGFRRGGSGDCTGMFLHGFRSHCDGGKARHLSDAARLRGRRWLRFDQRACGESGGRFQRFSVSQAIADARQVLTALQEPGCILVGSSLGALIAIHLARAEPDRVRGLVLIAPALRFTQRFIHDQLNDHELDRWRQRGYRWFPDLYAGGCFRLDYGSCADALGYGEPPGELPCPVRVVHGTRDELLPVEDVIEWLGRLECPDQGLEIIEGGDHRLTQWSDVIARQIDNLWNEPAKQCV